MTLLTSKQGCKVGWETYDNEVEAKAAAKRAEEDAIRLAAQGYDFGWSRPGDVTHIPAHPEYGECWLVVIP